jgi:hypothetical protein
MVTEKPMRYGLRSAFLVVTLLVLGLAYVANSIEFHRQRCAREARAITRIREAGGSISRRECPEAWIARLVDEQLGLTVHRVSLRHVDTASTMLPLLSAFPHLETLWLGNSNFSDDDVPILETLPQVTRVELAYTRITDASVESLSRLTQLRALNLDDTPLSDESFQKLRTQFPSTFITHNKSNYLPLRR